jgi:hypothetical protein
MLISQGMLIYRMLIARFYCMIDYNVFLVSRVLSHRQYATIS